MKLINKLKSLVESKKELSDILAKLSLPNGAKFDRKFNGRWVVITFSGITGGDFAKTLTAVKKVTAKYAKENNFSLFDKQFDGSSDISIESDNKNGSILVHDRSQR